MSFSYRKLSQLLCLSLVLVAGTVAQSSDAARSQRMDQIVQADVSAKNFMGAVLVARDGNLLLSKSYGSANLEWNAPNTPDTRFRLASLTKQFTAAAILLLEERGKLSGNDPVKKHLPDAPAAWDAVTIHHLLSHSSGVPNLTAFPDYYDHVGKKATPEQLIARFRDKPLDFPAGDHFAYSNSGYILLGHIIEKISGKPYAEFMQENIFTPLGMKDTGYDDQSKVLEKRAYGYENRQGTFVNAPFIHMSIPFAAGGLYSTTQDLLKWQQALVNGKLLKPESFTKMTTANKGGYGYGVFVRPLGTRKAISHGGGIEGFSTFMIHFPDEKLTVVLLSNVGTNALQMMGRNLSAIANGETVTLPSERKSVAVPAKVLAEYVGTYRFDPGFAMVVTLENGQLAAQATGQRKTALLAESETVFFPTVALEAKLEFVRDAAGKVTHMILHQGGRSTKAARE